MKNKDTPPSVWRNPIHFVAFGFGAGAIRIAPGTFGTLVAVPIYLLAQDMLLSYYLLFVAVLILLGVWLCSITAHDLGVEDHPGIVIDEIAGFMVTMIAAPSGWAWVVYGFILFRLFDIWKPWPINVMDRKVGGGLGIMLDDLVAGIFAYGVLQMTALFFY